ncbi:ribonuclease H-like [Trichomycterus rosablanca]|uniref:ribonuclease H-like n=1 Tax=Trichomycterus rosablanca TaxID=2290929 RepID=UPI002F35FEE5
MVNMTEGLNSDPDAEPHCCEQITQKLLKCREDLEDTPLEDPDLTLFCDGCCYKGDKGLVASYAVVKQTNEGFIPVDSGIIEQPASAQLAELVAITKALEKAADQTVNIYTDSAYAHSALHLDGPQWIRRGLVTAQGTPIKNATQIFQLLKAVNKPKRVAKNLQCY